MNIARLDGHSGTFMFVTQRIRAGRIGKTVGSLFSTPGLL
jgi:hypothetical protein